MQHVIKKQTIDLHVDKQLDSFRIQQQVSDHFWRSVVFLLEKEFDKISSEDELICLERVEIDLGIIPEKEIGTVAWNANIAELLKEQISQLISQDLISTEKVAVKRSFAASSYKQWLFYMRYGYLPWNAILINSVWYDNVIEELATNYNSVSELRKEIKVNEIVVMRIIRQHPLAFLIRLVEILTAEKQTELFTTVSEIYDKITDSATSASKARQIKNIAQQSDVLLLTYETICKQILIISSEINGQLSATLPVIKQQIHAALSFDRTNKKVDNLSEPPQTQISSLSSLNPLEQGVVQAEINVSKQIIADDGIYVQNAGLVLIHPFIQSLFKRVGFLNNNQFTSIKAQEKAIYLLHYVAMGKVKAEEHELVIPKMLCAYSMVLPMNNNVKLLNKEIKEADRMLKAAIASWGILKNTSIEGLREGFLQRSGKVSIRNEKTNLLVEKSAIDVLLDQLPWNLSIIKLPWLNDLLKVEWR
jgi:hypothetical protein